MLAAAVFIVLSQLALAALLLGTAFLDRPGPRLPRLQGRDPIAAWRAHRRQLASLGAATRRSTEARHL